MQTFRLSFFLFFSIFGIVASAPVFAEVPKEIRLKYEYQHFILSNPEKFLKSTTIVKSIANDPFCIAEDAPQDVSPQAISSSSVDLPAIEAYLSKVIAPQINQEKKDVRIFRDKKKNIQFEGYAQNGVTLQIANSAKLIAAAIQENIGFVNLEVDIIAPTVTVDDEELKQMGIKELVAVGRSDFSGSSGGRVHNVMTGANKFNGYIIPKDAVFSFTDRLGAVNAAAGYVKELVILGQKVVPDYGGGLCQVSSTAYRGAMLAGVEIVERFNHSYSVRYYDPPGSDATIYVGSKDFKFKNTTGNALLMQTRRGGRGNQELFFHYYGTAPDRDVYIFGPIIKNYRNPPAPKTTISEDLAPGQTQVVSHEVVGFDAYFYRDVLEQKKELYTDKFFSPYQARGVWTIKGADAAIPPSEVAQGVSD